MQRNASMRSGDSHLCLSPVVVLSFHQKLTSPYHSRRINFQSPNFEKSRFIQAELGLEQGSVEGAAKMQRSWSRATRFYPGGGGSEGRGIPANFGSGWDVEIARWRRQADLPAAQDKSLSVMDKPRVCFSRRHVCHRPISSFRWAFP